MKMRFILSFLIFFLSGCATISYLPSTSQKFSPTQSVEILWEKPQRSYIELGQISVESADYSEETLFKKLKQKAMEIGADAVIIRSTKPYTKTMGSWVFVGSTTVRRIEALAIKWKSEEINK